MSALLALPMFDELVSDMHRVALPPVAHSQVSDRSALAAETLRQEYTNQHGRVLQDIANLRRTWSSLASLSPTGLSPSEPGADSSLVPSIIPPPTAVDGTQTTQLIDTQIEALKAQVCDLEAQLAAASAAGSDASLLANDVSRACVEAGIRRRDHAFIQHIFDKHHDGNVKSPRISQTNLPAAIAELFSCAASGSNAPAYVPSAALDAAKLGGKRGLDFAEFVAATNAENPFGRYVGKLPLASIVTDALGAHVGADGDALHRFSQMPLSAMDSATQAATFGLKAELLKAQAEVSKMLAAQQKSIDQLASGKFQSSLKMACGGIDDFHKGLTGRVGAPNLKFLQAMRAEHCVKGGHNYEFTTGNYKIKTTPEREWLQIVGDENGVKAVVPAEDMKHGRVITDISELMTRPQALDADLEECEVIALSLYSGPLFEIYNSMLRQYPPEKYEAFHSQGNTFSTTIFVLVSAIQKLSRHMYLPPSMRLYRGFSSMEMPDSFYNVDDKTGCSGYAEWGFISTTSNKNVAIQYSGVDVGKPRATVLCIRPSSVDRGASIAEFSQYPGEEEYLWPPCSFLQSENSGSEVEVQPGGGVVTIMSVRVNANLGAQTVDQLREKKKEMHLASARLLADEVKQEVEQLAASVESLERKKRDVSFIYQKDCYQSFCAKINAQCDAIVERHRNTPAVDYVNDYSFRGLVSEILNMKSWAKEKWQLWLKDESKYIVLVLNVSLLECHRQWLSYLRKRIRDVGSDSDEGPSLCIELLRSKGLIKAAAHGEANAEGEDLIVAAGAEGWSAEDVSALLMAGADVATADENGRTGVWTAASFGNVLTLKALLAAGGDVNTFCNDSDNNKEQNIAGATAVYIAAMNGQTDCVVELIASKADVLQCTGNGWSPLLAASFGGHVSCVEALIGSKADVLQCDEDGRSPLYAASEGGHVSCVEALIGSKADVLQCDGNSGSPLYAASFGGHVSCVEALIGSKADVLQCEQNGWSPLYAASEGGHVSCVEALIGSKADVLQCDGNGWSPLYAASRGGHVSCVEALIGSKADVLQCTGNGRSPLYAASDEGHVSCVEALIGSKADVLQCNNKGVSPLQAALSNGFADCVVSPVQAALSKGHADCVAALVRAGAVPP